MGFLHRSRETSSKQIGELTSREAEEELTAESFLESQEELLIASRTNWALVGQSFEPLKTDKFYSDKVREGLDIFINSERDRLSLPQSACQSLRQKLYPAGNRLLMDAGPYFYTSASYLATKTPKVRSLGHGLSAHREILKLPDPLVSQIFGHILKSPVKGAQPFIVDAPDRIRTGHVLRQQIIGNLAEAIYQHPALMAEIIAAKNDVNPAFFDELKKLSAVDWYGPVESSQLRSCVARIEAEDDLHLDGFITAVESTRDNGNNYNRIRQMGQFAIAASGVDPTSDPELREPLLNARPFWGYFEVDKAFEEFKKSQTAKLQTAIKSFVGNEHDAWRNIRFPRTKNDFEEAKKKFTGYFRLASRTRRSAPSISLPDLQEIVNEGYVSKITHESTDDAELRLTMLKRTVGGPQTVSVSPGELVASLPDAPRLKEEVMQMIEILQKDPKGQGTQNIKAQIRVRIGGKKLTLRQFSPMRRTGFSVSNEAKGYRVVYGVKDKDLVIVDIIRRDDFESKYT